MTHLQIARLRLRNQGLDGKVLERPEQVVQWLGAVQAQDYAGAKWACAQRTRGITSAAIDDLFAKGRLLRTHVMRPTWHFVLPDDIRWMLKLTAPRVKSATASYDRKLELDDAVYARCNDVIAAALQRGRQLTRQELAAILREAGIAASGSRLGHIMMRAELDAVICSGALRGKQFTYALLDERVPPGRMIEREEALVELARRYFTSHGPATAQDFSWWSGLSAADARTGLEMVRSELVSEPVDGRMYWYPDRPEPPAAKKPVMHLLPNYDEHVVAYRHHGPSLDDTALKHRLPADQTLNAHLIARNGLIIGGWRRVSENKSTLIRTQLNITLTKTEQAELQAATEEYGRFLEQPVRLSN
jgi:hypothetical protein